MSRCDDYTCKPSALAATPNYLSQSALSQFQRKESTSDPKMPLDFSASATECNLDSKGLETSKLFVHDQRDESNKKQQSHIRRTDIPAPPLLRQGTGMKQVGWERPSRGITASGDTMMRSLAQADVDLKRPTGTAASQQAVLEALKASVSRAESSGDAKMVELLKSIQGQLVRI